MDPLPLPRIRSIVGASVITKYLDEIDLSLWKEIYCVFRAEGLRHNEVVEFCSPSSRILEDLYKVSLLNTTHT